MSPEELKQYEDMVNDYRYADSIFKPVVVKLLAEVRRLDAWCNHTMKQWDESVKELTDYIDSLEAECEMLAELMPDCPVSYGGSVWCRRLCPVFGRHDDEENYYCTTAERREFARKEIERDEEDRVRRERDEATDAHVGEGN